eukprot:UN24071
MNHHVKLSSNKVPINSSRYFQIDGERLHLISMPCIKNFIPSYARRQNIFARIERRQLPFISVNKRF